MSSLARIGRLGGVSLVVLSLLAVGGVMERGFGEAQAAQPVELGDIQPPMGAPMSFADLIERVSPAVVTIQVNMEIEIDGAPDLESVPPQFREWLERQFGGPMPQPQERQSLGSGFFIAADGHIVTNNHVVANATEITVGLSNGDEYPATLIGADLQTDLALLKVEADRDFPYVSLAEEVGVRVGDWVVAVGNPFGLGGTATAGIISATGREIGSSTYNDFIQIDAPINRGNSGGPTFDLNGRVIGVNSQIFSPSGGNVGIGFAIPSDTAARIVGQLQENGRVARGWLGVQIQNVTPDIAESLGMDEPRGAIISSVVAGGPAADAGFERSDVVLSIDGAEVEGSRDLTRRVGAVAAGETSDFRVLRDGEEITISVTLRDRPDEQTLNAMSTQEAEPQLAEVFGMRMEALTEEDRERLGLDEDVSGLTVAAVQPSGEAYSKGLRAGEVVIEAGGEGLVSFEDFSNAVDTARDDGRSAILLLVQGRGGQRYVALQLDAD